MGKRKISTYYYLFKKKDGDDNIYDKLKNVDFNHIYDLGLQYCESDGRTLIGYNKFFTRTRCYVRGDSLRFLLFQVILSFPDRALSKILDEYTVLSFNVNTIRFSSVDLLLLQEEFIEAHQDYLFAQQADLDAEFELFCEESTDVISNLVIESVTNIIPEACKSFLLHTIVMPQPDGTNPYIGDRFTKESSATLSKSEIALMKSRNKNDEMFDGFIGTICYSDYCTIFEHLLTNSLADDGWIIAFLVSVDRTDSTDTLMDMHGFKLETNDLKSPTDKSVQASQDTHVEYIIEKMDADFVHKLIQGLPEKFREKCICRGLTDDDIIHPF